MLVKRAVFADGDEVDLVVSSHDAGLGLDEDGGVEGIEVVFFGLIGRNPDDGGGAGAVGDFGEVFFRASIRPVFRTEEGSDVAEGVFVGDAVAFQEREAEHRFGPDDEVGMILDGLAGQVFVGEEDGLVVVGGSE